MLGMNEKYVPGQTGGSLHFGSEMPDAEFVASFVEWSGIIGLVGILFFRVVGGEIWRLL